MRVIAILIIAAVALMFLGGWLYFRDSDSTSEVILDKEEVQQDTRKAMETGERVLEKAAGGLKELGDQAEDALSDDKTPPETTKEGSTEQPVDSP